MIISEFPGNIFTRGTATLISENVLVTAAHCLYIGSKASKQEFTPAIEVTFIPGGSAGGAGNAFSTKQTPSRGIIADGFLIHEEYFNREEHYDIGVVKLPANIGLRTGYASLVVPNIQDLESTLATVTGYPAQKGFMSYVRNKPVYDMYTMSGPITSVKKHKFHYRIDTSGGQSGAGVWLYNDKAEVECFGIHVTGHREEGNGAIRIDEDNFKMINMWKDKLNKLNQEKTIDKEAS